MNYDKSYIGILLNAISQGLHALAGGHSDVSMSGKTGYLSKKSKWFRIMRKMIDVTFLAFDGSDHCVKAYERDRNENYDLERKVGKIYITRILISAFQIIGCAILFIPFWTYHYIKKWI